MLRGRSINDVLRRGGGVYLFPGVPEDKGWPAPWPGAVAPQSGPEVGDKAIRNSRYARSILASPRLASRISPLML